MSEFEGDWQMIELRRWLIAMFLLVSSGCTITADSGFRQPAVDLSPLDCGYKWFQSGYSPTLEMSCEADRSQIVDEQMALARQHAREVARARCPEVCPPEELVDPGDPGDAFPEGICNAGYVYFTSRLFFQCAERNRGQGN